MPRSISLAEPPRESFTVDVGVVVLPALTVSTVVKHKKKQRANIK